MIQRIQSLYLLIVTILMAVVFFVPTTIFTHEVRFFIIESPLHEESSLAPDEEREPVPEVAEVIDSKANEGFSFRPFDPVLLSATFALAAILPLIIIFLYKKRRLQIKFCVAEIILLLAGGVLAAVGLYNLKAYNGPLSWWPTIPAILIVLSLALTILAIRAIARDEKLVRSLDRLR